MPLEGHWERQNTSLRRLSPRERILAAVAGVATAVALLVFVVVAVSDSRPEPSRGCVSAVLPGVVGGMTYKACGERARTLCAHRATQRDVGSRAIQTSCRRAGFL
jgi:hypothetical protein